MLGTELRSFAKSSTLKPGAIVPVATQKSFWLQKSYYDLVYIYGDLTCKVGIWISGKLQCAACCSYSLHERKHATCSKQLALGTSPAILMTRPFVSVKEILSGLWSMEDRVRLRTGGICVSEGVQNDTYVHVLIWTGFRGVQLKQLLWSPSSKISPLCSQGQMQGR